MNTACTVRARWPVTAMISATGAPAGRASISIIIPRLFPRRSLVARRRLRAVLLPRSVEPSTTSGVGEFKCLIVSFLLRRRSWWGKAWDVDLVFGPVGTGWQRAGWDLQSARRQTAIR